MLCSATEKFDTEKTKATTIYLCRRCNVFECIEICLENDIETKNDEFIFVGRRNCINLEQSWEDRYARCGNCLTRIGKFYYDIKDPTITIVRLYRNKLDEVPPTWRGGTT